MFNNRLATLVTLLYCTMSNQRLFMCFQIVCDSKNLITHLDSSLAGSANDAYAFTTSALYDEAENGVWDDFLLLGDSG